MEKSKKCYKFNFISIFAGCGGSSLGYKWAGGKELLAIDWDNNAVETFKLNFPNIPIWKRDITKVIAKEILEFCSLKKNELDLLDGSPPCQGFSIAGKRIVGDSRNDLTLQFIRLLKGLRPKVFLIENVKGMIEGKMKGYFKMYFRKCRKIGYNVKAKLMNAKYYSVPQSRERIIIIGIRNDLNVEPSFPKPNNKLISVKKALENIKVGMYYKPGDSSVIRSYINRIKEGQTGADYHPKGNFFNLRRLTGNKPSYTIPKNASRNIIHYKKNRFITDEEAKRLCSFPDNFKLKGSAIQKIGVLGNAVMPKFMEAIAEHIVKIMNW